MRRIIAVAKAHHLPGGRQESSRQQILAQDGVDERGLAGVELADHGHPQRAILLRTQLVEQGALGGLVQRCKAIDTAGLVE